jgi:hypothetical protein
VAHDGELKQRSFLPKASLAQDSIFLLTNEPHGLADPQVLEEDGFM